MLPARLTSALVLEAPAKDMDVLFSMPFPSLSPPALQPKGEEKAGMQLTQDMLRSFKATSVKAAAASGDPRAGTIKKIVSSERDGGAGWPVVWGAGCAALPSCPAYVSGPWCGRQWRT